jgi:hypothetical protein
MLNLLLCLAGRPESLVDPGLTTNAAMRILGQLRQAASQLLGPTGRLKKD